MDKIEKKMVITIKANIRSIGKDKRGSRVQRGSIKRFLKEHQTW